MTKSSILKPANYDQFAAIYDVDMGTNIGDADISFYVERVSTLAPVLELGCGTGRVMEALVAKGIRTVGIDLSQEMLARALRRLESFDRDFFSLVHADMTRFRLQEKGRAAICAFSTYSKLLSQDEQKQFFQTVALNLERGAVLILDMFQQTEAFLAKKDGERVLDYEKRWFPEKICFLTRHKRIWKEVRPNINRIVLEYDFETQGGEVLERLEIEDYTRHSSRAEIEKLLYESGFVDVQVFGGYQGQPYSIQGGQMIFEAYIGP
ncbi:MAG: class I SAM-dependent methyltransferase [Bdellovibrionales bacterium]|nr:class I SAM-dependent methyltransferase [Bdellovibrionales bacterium]